MNTIQNGNTPNAPRRWSPAPYAPPAAQYQAFHPASKLGADAPVSAAESFMRSPLLALLTDIAAAAAGGYLAYGLNARRNDCLREATASKEAVVKVRKDKAGNNINVYGRGMSLEQALDRCPGTGWSTFWWIASTALAVKALHDLSEMNA